MASGSSDIEMLLAYLKSNRVTDRRKAINELSEIITSRNIRTCINNSSTFTWNILLGNSQIAIKKECERLFDQDRSGLKCNKDKHFSAAASFFLLIVKTAIKEGIDRLNIPKLINYICGSLQENSMRICVETFLKLIKDYILVNVNCLGCLKHDNFEQLFSLLKSEFLRLTTTENNSPTNDLYNCICLLVKHGPLSGFPQSFFREQFEFISNIGQSVLEDHSRQLHEMAVEIVLNFCIHNAEDNRISCVELGEKVLSNFFNLYFTVGRDSVFKVNFIEFCLLQMVLHHPKGVPENDSRSYALNWHDWNSYVKRIYGILTLEITQYLQQYVKNTLLFQNQKKTVVILGSLVNLFVEVFKQLVTNNESNLDSSVMENDTTFSQAQKKRKITAITTESIINEIASTQSWVWVKLLGAAIKKYPELIDKDLFINLIQTLHKLHLDVSDHITISYIYETLIILIDIESQLGFSNEYAIINLWKLMGESALRIIGLNQNLQETNIFLRILIFRNIVNIDSVIATFTSGVLVITEHHIDTLKIILEKVNFSKLELVQRGNIFNCLLNIQTLDSASRSVLNPNFARIIVALSLKQCPEFEKHVENPILKDFTEKLVDIYERVHFASFTAITSTEDSSNRNKSKINRIYNVDCNAMNLLTEKLKILVDLCETQSVSNIFCLIGLLYNILSCLVDYQIIDLSQVEEHFLLTFVKKLLELEKTKIFQTYHSHKRSVLNELIKVCGVLQDIFNLNNSVTGLVKDLFTQDFLRELMQVLQYFQCEVRDSEDLEIELQIKKLLITLLTKFCVVSNRNVMSSNQKLLISALSKPDYDFFSENDYDLSISLLENAVLAQPGFLPSEVIADLLEGLRGFCTIKYRNYQFAEHIIKVLTTLFPHLSCNNDSITYQTKAIELIYPFFKRRSHYGPDLSECILNAIEELCRVDPNFRATKWEGKELIKYVPEFLCSDFQRIRHKAVDVLVLFFNTSSNSGDIEAIHFLEEIFDSIYNWNMKVFEIECELTDARKRDEVTLRASSALYPFISILINCTDWAEESFFAIAKLEKVKQLFTVEKGDLMNRALLLIENYYNTDNSKRIFIEYILTKWISLGYSINDLEYRLFGCPNKINLYMKYFDICSSLMINLDREDLISAGAQLNMTEKDVLEHCCTRNFSRMISVHVNSLESKFIENNTQLSYIVQQLEGRFKEVLIEKIDELILVLLGGVSDVKNFQNLLNDTICFISKGISINEYERCLHYIENLLCNNQNIIEFLNIKRKNKIEQIILNLQTALYKTISINHQLRRFHQYIIFTNQLLKSITYDPTMTTFFIRNTLYFLINLNYNIQVERLQKVSLKYLNYFLKQILPNNVVEFKQFLNLVVNSLKNIAVHNEKLSSLCIDMLKFIIIENSYYLNDCMSKLDVFPSTFMFKDIKEVHDKFKYRENDTTLKDEIQSFLEYTDLATKQNSLRNLKTMLSKEKQQLKELYDELNEMKGFSEDCEKSILHKLTIVLIELARFPNNEQISDEAMRCLGELGPADLTTVILKPEKGVLAIQCSPSELFHGHILSILTQYIVDPDIKVAAASSSALYRLLNSNEGKKVLKNQNDFGYGVINKQFVTPYILDSAKYASNLKISFENFLMLVDNSELWIPTNNLKSSKEWIRELVLAFLNSFNSECYVTNLAEVCKATDKFCEQILALLIYLFISLNDDRVIEVLAKNINKFFAQHWEMTKENKIPKNSSIPVNKKALKSILDVINFLRQQTNLIEKIGKLKFNYLSIAKAASYCSSHFSALLYTELWCKEKMNDVDLSNKFENDSNIVDYIYENVPQDVGIVFQQILQESYRSIGDLDALLGCGVSLLLRPEYRVEYYKYTEQWSSVMDYYSTLPLSKDHHQTESAANLVQSLKMNNFHQLVLYNDKIEYECLWRLGQWDVIEKDDDNISNNNNNNNNNSAEFRYDKNKFYCLKSLCENDNYTYSITKKELKCCLIDKLKQASLEGSKNLYKIFTNLQSLVEIEDCFEAVEQKNFTNIFEKWKIQDSIIRKNAFQYVEPIIAQRLTLLREFIKLNPNLKQAYIDLSLNYSDYARNELRLKEAVAAINNIRYHILDVDVNIENEIQFREAQLAWLKNDKRIAKKILRKLCNTTTNPGITPKLEANCLMLQAIYMAETYSDRTSVLQHFEAAIEIYKNINCSNVEDYYNFQNVYDKIAMFADREYQQIMNYINSDSFQKKLTNIRSCKEMARALKDQREKSNDEKRALIFHEKQIRFDENEVATTLKEKTVVLELALKYHIKNLSLCDTNNIKIFRIIALFLENRDNKESLALLNELLNQIPTYKYVTVLPQLIPHITSNQTDLFGKHVNRIIEKCALDHPHHTLPLLLALVKADKDKEFSSSTTKKNTNERTTVAIHLVKKLMKNEKLNDIIKKMLQLSDALIELAYFVDQAVSSSSSSSADNNNSRKTDFNIPSKLKISKLNDLQNILVPTYSLPISKTNNYDQIVGILKFGRKYKTVGGINAPKCIECFSTTGQVHSQLVKGHDDLRQDAVMQQVFNIMNNLLSTNKQTKSLSIRTYKIVPLSMRSGILEWVANTIPIGDYLSGNSGAHKVFRPKDKSINECRAKFRACAEKSVETKLKVYNSICKDIRPVFHKFFEMHFRQPSVWYERRRAYIHSVATTSMVGYILGIGDRHVSNILIDKKTAEVIHIDFGIAFEQGICLPTPETVPFRLTRDLVDGMGVSGVEGLFRKSCEKTMEVLKSNSQTILTILEVLLYDPLYFWTVSIAEARKRQTDDDVDGSIAEDVEEENKNISAERALLRLRAKLEGTENGKSTSVEHQVERLIQQAVDPFNLCRLFNGWQPYLFYLCVKMLINEFEKKLKDYRKKKQREERINYYKQLIKGIFSKFLMENKEIKNDDDDNNQHESSNNKVNIIKVISIPDSNSKVDLDESDHDEDEEEIERPCTKIDYLIYGLWFILWVTVYVIFIKLEFGTVFFIISGLVGIYLNTRTRPKRKNEISAYSVFNKNCEKIDGTLDGEKMTRDMLYGGFSR